MGHAAQLALAQLELVLPTQSLEGELECPQAVVERNGVVVEYLGLQRAGEEAAQHALLHERLVELRRERAAMRPRPELAVGSLWTLCSLWQLGSLRRRWQNGGWGAR